MVEWSAFAPLSNNQTDDNAAFLDSRHSRNRPEPATIAPPMIRLTVGKSPQIAKPSIIAQISEKYWNGETTDVGAR